MPLIDQFVPAPVGGVTQLPPTLRGPAQVAEAINTFPSLVEGLGVRHGTELLTEDLEIGEPSLAHSFEWSPVAGTRYWVTIGSQGILVTDVNNNYTYTPASRGESAEQREAFFGTAQEPNRFTSAVVGNTAFVGVRGMSKAQWSGERSPAAQTPEAPLSSVTTVYIKKSMPGPYTYRFVVTVPENAPSSVYAFEIEVAAGQQFTEQRIAAEMAGVMNSVDGFKQLYGVTASGANIIIGRFDTEDTRPIAIEFTDAATIGLVREEYVEPTDLPETAPEGFVVKVSGVSRTTQDDYWLVFSEGRWRESVAPNSFTTLDNHLMPWQLTNEVIDGEPTFTFGPAEWGARSAGDDALNPLPLLDPIDLIFTTEQRLGFTSGSTIVMSQTGSPLNIFRRSVSQLLADDAINVLGAVGPASSSHAALEWDSSLYLWSEQVQVEVQGDPALTPTTISLKAESRFENDAQVTPIVIGSRIYFVRTINGATRVYEYWRPPGYNMPPTVNDVTQQVPTYLQGAPVSLTGDESLGFLAVKTDAAADTLYVCHFSRDGNGQIVPRWHTWQFADAEIHAVQMLGGRLYLLLSRYGLTNIESLDVANPWTFAEGMATDGGYAFVTPHIVMDSWYPRDEGGTITEGRFTIRNLTVNHNRTIMAVMDNVTDDTPMIESPVLLYPDAGQIRVPLMRLNKGLTITAQWLGFITGFQMQGSTFDRNLRK